MSYQELQEFLNKKRVERWRVEHGISEAKKEDSEYIKELKKRSDQAKADMKQTLSNMGNAYQTWKQEMGGAKEKYKAGSKNMDKVVTDLKNEIKAEWERSDKAINKRLKWFIEFMFGKGSKI